MPADYLYTLAEDLLDAALDGLALARTGHAPPARTFVGHGDPAVEGCDQLSVHLDGRRAVWFHARPDRPPVARTALVAPQAGFRVQLWRCWPADDGNGNPPTVTQLSDAAEGLYRDAWSMLTQILTEWRAGTLFTGVSCEAVTVGDLSALGPTGSTAGWDLPISVLLNDSGP